MDLSAPSRPGREPGTGVSINRPAEPVCYTARTPNDSRNAAASRPGTDSANGTFVRHRPPVLPSPLQAARRLAPSRPLRSRSGSRRPRAGPRHHQDGRVRRGRGPDRSCGAGAHTKRHPAWVVGGRRARWRRFAAVPRRERLNGPPGTDPTSGCDAGSRVIPRSTGSLPGPAGAGRRGRRPRDHDRDAPDVRHSRFPGSCAPHRRRERGVFARRAAHARPAIDARHPRRAARYDEKRVETDPGEPDSAPRETKRIRQTPDPRDTAPVPYRAKRRNGKDRDAAEGHRARESDLDPI